MIVVERAVGGPTNGVQQLPALLHHHHLIHLVLHHLLLQHQLHHHRRLHHHHLEVPDLVAVGETKGSRVLTEEGVLVADEAVAGEVGQDHLIQTKLQHEKNQPNNRKKVYTAAVLPAV